MQRSPGSCLLTQCRGSLSGPISSTLSFIGVTFSNDFSFAVHIESVFKSANASLPTLNSMHRFNANTESITYAYIMYICPILEYAFPVWVPSALRAVYLYQELESIRASIILDHCDIPYEKVLEVLGLLSLQKPVQNSDNEYWKVLAF